MRGIYSPSRRYSVVTPCHQCPETAQLLRDLRGAKLVACLGNVQETRAVRQWAEGTREIANPEVVERLRLAIALLG